LIVEDKTQEECESDSPAIETVYKSTQDAAKDVVMNGKFGVGEGGDEASIGRHGGRESAKKDSIERVALLEAAQDGMEREEKGD